MNLWAKMRWWEQITFLVALALFLVTVPTWVVAAGLMLFIVWHARDDDEGDQ